MWRCTRRIACAEAAIDATDAGVSTLATRAPVAQGIERAPPEREVEGSNPSGRIGVPLRSRPWQAVSGRGATIISLRVGVSDRVEAGRAPGHGAPPEWLPLGFVQSARHRGCRSSLAHAGPPEPSPAGA